MHTLKNSPRTLCTTDSIISPFLQGITIATLCNSLPILYSTFVICDTYVHTYVSTYVGETENSLKARFGEHRRPSSTTSEVSKHIHTDSPDHTITLENMKILAVEHKWFERGVKEAIHIRALKSSLNRDGGRYNLPPDRE